MEIYHNIDAFLDKIKNNILQNPAESISITPPVDVKIILEILNTTNDINLQIKLFSVLSACVIFDANFNIITKCRAIYDKINTVLKEGMPYKAVHALHFLRAIIDVDEREDATTKQNLVLFAKNMIRISGCLSTMNNMFKNCMMYHDTWVTLCQCIADACSDCELNQSFCSHLIPTCIQKCNSTNIEIFVVLQNLLQNHNRNIKLFLDKNGMAVFTREVLHYDTCLHLLITVVVQNPDASQLLVQQTQVLDGLQDFLRYGADSQIGQKAKIILYYIESHAKGLQNVQDNQEKTVITTNEDALNEILSNNDQNDVMEYEIEKHLDDTDTLMKNVIKEIYQIKQTEHGSLNTLARKRDTNSFITNTLPIFPISRGLKNSRNSFILNNLNSNQEQRHQENNSYGSEASFSYWQNENDCIIKKKYGVLKNNKDTHFPNSSTSNWKQMDQRQKEKPHNNNDTEPPFSYWQNENDGRTKRNNRGLKNTINTHIPNYSPTNWKQMDQRRNEKSHNNNDTEPSFSYWHDDSDGLSKRNNRELNHNRQKCFPNYSTKTMKQIDEQLKEKKHNNPDTECSFLQNDNVNLTCNRSHMKTGIDKQEVSYNTRKESERTLTTSKLQPLVNVEEDLSNCHILMSEQNCTFANLQKFRPKFSSTPKQEFLSRMDFSGNSSRRTNLTAQTYATHCRRNIVKRKAYKVRNEDKSLRKTSMTSRFLSAINESCTALVKTVASIFKNTDSANSSKNISTNTQLLEREDDPSCSYSFLKYMRKRAVLKSKSPNKIYKNCSMFSAETSSCDTCNDTTKLKMKLILNDELKLTVKKLKWGINLYGCDFKKISRTMWPQNSYMTHKVLYNIYRKLILKKAK